LAHESVNHIVVTAVTEKRCGKLAVISSGYIYYLNVGRPRVEVGAYFNPSEIHSKEL